MKAIILDGQLKSALATVRSLGKKGITVSVGAERATGMALHSIYATHTFVYPSPYTDQSAFIDAVIQETVRIGGKPLVYAFSDATFLSLYTHRTQLSEFVTLEFPDEKAIDIAFDKAATYSLAHVSGIPTITTYTPETVEEMVRLSESLQYPVVIKTRRSVTWNNGGGVFGSASFIQHKESLQKKFTELKEKLGESPLVQEVLYGEEYGVEMLVQKGKVYAQVVHHRLRSLSPTGGASVLKEIVDEGDLRYMLVTYAEKLVQKLAWTGPIMVEFKVDSDSREPKLMEINGRFWGSLPLSIAAGVDMPYLYYRSVCMGGDISSLVTDQAGVVTRHFLGDLRHLLRVLFARDHMRNTLYPRRLSAVYDFFFLPKGTQSDVWLWSDVKPFFFEFIDGIKKIWK